MKRILGLNIILKIVALSISFLYVPKVLIYLGAKHYGVWMTILSILSWINILDIGIGNGLRNQLVIYLENKKENIAQELVSTAYTLITVISMLLFGILVIFLYFIDLQKLLNVDIPNLKKVFIYSLFFVNLNFILSLCKPIYFALQKSFIVNLIDISLQLINFLGIILFLYFNLSENLLYVCLLYGMSSVISNLYFTYKLFSENKLLFPKLQFFRKKRIRELGTLGIRFFILQIAAIVIYSTDSIIITKLFGAEEVTPYNIVLKIFGIITVFHSVLVSTLWSKVTKEFVKGNSEYIRKLLKKLHFLTLILIPILFLFVKIFPYISKIWLSQDLNYQEDLVLYVAIYTLLNVWCNNYTLIMNGSGKINFQMLLSIFNMIINIPLSLYFAKNLELGVKGVILATIVCRLLSAILYPINNKNELKKGMIQ